MGHVAAIRSGAPSSPDGPCSRRPPKRSFVGMGAHEGSARSRSTGASAATRSCPGSRDGRSQRSRAVTSSSGCCVPACNAGRGRSAGAGHLVHRGPGGRLWTPACRKQFISRPEPRSLTRPLQMVGEAVLRPEAAMILLLREGIDAIGPPFARETTNLNLVFAA